MSLFGHKQKTVEPDVIPTTVEQAIPIRDVCEDGIFLVGRNLWSKTYRFTDVNYATASKEDKEGMFFAYSEILNTFDAGAMTKITVNNRRLNQTKFRENNMLELQGDSLDKYRNEYNRILAGNANLSKDGSVKERNYGIYVCYHRSRGLNDCDGATTYIADRVDKCVLQTVHEIFANIAGCPEEEKIQLAFKRSVEASRLEQLKLTEQIAKDEKQLEGISGMLNTIMSTALTRAVAYRMVCGFAADELLGGVTTIRTVGGLGDFDTRLRDEIAAGRRDGPRILAANRGISVPGGHMAGSVAIAAHSIDEALAHLERSKKEGVDLIKLMITGGVLDAKEKGVPGELKMAPEMVRAVCDRAHEMGYIVAAHVESPEGVRVALENDIPVILSVPLPHVTGSSR